MDINKKWKEICIYLQKQFDSDTPDMKVILFLIGMQELANFPQKTTRRQKEEIIHIALCKLLSIRGYYQFQKMDEDGWPHWENVKKVPAMGIFEEEYFIKELCVEYFSQKGIIKK